MVGALSVISVLYRTSISSSVSSSYANSVPLSISKTTGHLFSFLYNLTAAKFAFANSLVYVLWNTEAESVI